MTEDDKLLPTSAVQKRYGDRSRMWIERRLDDDPAFPKPIYIAKRRYWHLSELVAYERGKVVEREAANMILAEPATA